MVSSFEALVLQDGDSEAFVEGGGRLNDPEIRLDTERYQFENALV